MSTQPISPSASLTSLAEQFTQWRATRSRLRSPVPTALRQQALELLSARLQPDTAHDGTVSIVVSLTAKATQL